MTTEILISYIFSCIAIAAGIMLIRAKNPVHSVLFLILVFCNCAGLLIMLELDFFAMIFLIVYVGAIAVLFLFVVMMLNIKLSEINENVLRYLPIGGLIGVIFVYEILTVLNSDLIPIVKVNMASSDFFFAYIPYYFYSLFASKMDQAPEIEMESFNIYSVDFIQWPLKVATSSNIEALGQLIYTYYFYYFILASFILLIAMIGAITLTMHKGIHVKRQQIFEQNIRDFSKTIKKIR